MSKNAKHVSNDGEAKGTPARSVKERAPTQIKTRKPPPDKPRCGIIMPISAIDNCDVQHWGDVREIIENSIVEAGFEPHLVSDADEVGIIQKRIIQNVYDDPIVVYDVSGKNPNVMFELGMRLAFDKPAIIIKDDKTSYTFDTAPIEHVEYRRDLRFAEIVEFQQVLAGKITATASKAKTDRNYTTFLKNFGSFSVAKIETTPVSRDDYILDELRAMKSLLLRRPVSQLERELPPMEIISDTRTRKWLYLNRIISHALADLPARRRRSKTTETAALVRDYILSHSDPAKYFANGSEFNEALAMALRSRGLKVGYVRVRSGHPRLA